MKIYLKYLIKPFIFLLGLTFIFNGCMKDREPTAPTPLDRPVMTGNSQPVNGELNVSVNSLIKVDFTEKMDVSTLPSRFLVQDFNGNTISGTYSVQDSEAIFSPSQGLDKSTLYKLILKGRLRDIYRNSISFNGDPIYDDTTLIYTSWFYTEGSYSENGFYRIYAADKSNIYIIDKLDKIISTITYSPLIISGLSISEDDNYLLVSIEAKNRIDFINLKSEQIEKSLTVSNNPQSIVVKDNYAYVVCVNGQTIEKVNLNTKNIESTFALNFYPGKIAISNNGNTLYTLDQLTKDLVSIEASTGNILNKINNSFSLPATGEIKVDDSNRLFICDFKANKLSVIDDPGQSVSNIKTAFTFPLKSSPVNIALDDNSLYIAAGESIYKLDKQNFNLLDQLTYTSDIKSLTIIPSKDLLYAITPGSCIIIDLKTFTELKEFSTNSSNLQFVVSSNNKI